MAYNEKDGMYYGYIYKIINNVNDKVYIGQTTTNTKLRWAQHITEAKSFRFNEMILYKSMRKYGIDNFRLLEVEEISANTKDELIELLNNKEMYYISSYNTLLPNGYNMTIGGGNNSERIKKPVDSYFADGTFDAHYESINEASRAISGNTNCCNNIFQCCVGKREYAYKRIWRYSCDSFDKYEVKHTQEEIERYKNRTVICQYSLDGTLIKSYPSISNAAMSLGYKYNRTTDISNCCKGITRTAFGYVWRFDGDEFDKYTIANK